MGRLVPARPASKQNSTGTRFTASILTGGLVLASSNAL